MHERVFSDPLNDHITESSFAEERQQFVAILDLYRKHPQLIQLLFMLSVLTPVLTLTFIIVFNWYNSFFIYLIIFSIIPGVLFYYKVTSIQNDLLLYPLCVKNGWVFKPKRDFDRARRMAHLFPYVFARGDVQYRRLENQMWGTLGKEPPVNFWSGIFTYELQETDPNQKMIKEVTDIKSMFIPHVSRDQNVNQLAVFILELDKAIPCAFSLSRYGSRRDLQTESIAFNETFRIRTHHVSKHTQTQIMQVLSPSVQVRLVDFANEVELDSITFEHNCMVILCRDTFWETKHTSFFKNVTIDERDLKLFDDLLTEMSELPLEMRKFLD